jgi:hypothetical protein
LLIADMSLYSYVASKHQPKLQSYSPSTLQELDMMMNDEHLLLTPLDHEGFRYTIEMKSERKVNTD